MTTLLRVLVLGSRRLWSCTLCQFFQFVRAGEDRSVRSGWRGEETSEEGRIRGGEKVEKERRRTYRFERHYRLEKAYRRYYSESGNFHYSFHNIISSRSLLLSLPLLILYFLLSIARRRTGQEVGRGGQRKGRKKDERIGMISHNKRSRSRSSRSYKGSPVRQRRIADEAVVD